MTTHRAKPLQVPTPTAAETLALKQDAAQLQTAEAVERARQVRGLLWLVLAVLVFSIWRAGADNVFTHGWWRLW